MKNNHHDAVCAICFQLGVVLPWGFLISAGVIGALTSSDYWGETAAWFAAIGLFLMAGSYLLTKIINSHIENHG